MRTCIRPLIAVVAIIVATAGVARGARGPVPGAGPWLQYEDVRLGGFDAAKLESVRSRADELGSGAVFIVRGGVVVAAWGDVERRFKCHSVRKSLLSALYGAAVARGDIDLQATLSDLDIDDVHVLTEAEKKATVEHLIQSRSGVYHPAAKEPRSMKKRRPERGSAGPGETFWYNNWDFNTAGYVFEQATSRGIFDAFLEDLARPLGMEDFRLEDTFYQYERGLSRVPAYAFRLSARDAARFGLLYLRDGKWAQKQLVPADWIEGSWAAHSDLGDNRGYGYMWWIYGPGSNPSRPDLTAYAASGTGGQLIVVVPGLDLVIVHRGDTDFAAPLRGGDVWELVRGIIDSIDGEARRSQKLQELRPQPFTRQLPPLSFPEIVSLPQEVLDRYVGHYIISPEVRVDVRRMDDFLVGTMTGMGETDFFPVSETKFWSRAAGATVTFELDDRGDVVRGTLRLRGQEMIAIPATSPAASLDAEAEESLRR